MSTEGVSLIQGESLRYHDRLGGQTVMEKIMKKIAVIGAGITGVTTAYQLMKEGYKVTIFEKQRYAAMETSFANGSIISMQWRIWTNWKTIFKALNGFFKKDAPLYINLKPSFHKLSWFLDFLFNVQNHEKNTIATVKMALESNKILKNILCEEDINFDLKKKETSFV